MTKQHDGQVQECKSIFVSWVWLVGILFSLVSAFTILAWNGGSRLSTITNDIQSCKTDIGNLKIINRDLDTIKAMLRNENGK